MLVHGFVEDHTSVIKLGEKPHVEVENWFIIVDRSWKATTDQCIYVGLCGECFHTALHTATLMSFEAALYVRDHILDKDMYQYVIPHCAGFTGDYRIVRTAL